MTKEKHVKPQGTIKPTPGGTAHIPKSIRIELGYPKEIPYVADAHTVILFNPKKSLDEILESIEVLVRDLHLRAIPEGVKKK